MIKRRTFNCGRMIRTGILAKCTTTGFVVVAGTYACYAIASLATDFVSIMPLVAAPEAIKQMLVIVGCAVQFAAVGPVLGLLCNSPLSPRLSTVFVIAITFPLSIAACEL